MAGLALPTLILPSLDRTEFVWRSLRRLFSHFPFQPPHLSHVQVDPVMALRPPTVFPGPLSGKGGNRRISEEDDLEIEVFEWIFIGMFRISGSAKCPEKVAFPSKSCRVSQWREIPSPSRSNPLNSNRVTGLFDLHRINGLSILASAPIFLTAREFRTYDREFCEEFQPFVIEYHEYGCRNDCEQTEMIINTTPVFDAEWRPNCR
jgi:hypothetical protein